MELALEAQSLWRSDPILKPYYHETGILFARTSGPGETIENYNALMGSSPARIINPKEAKAGFDGIYRDAPWDKLGVMSRSWNPTAGWGEAEKALRSVIQGAVNLGVNYVEATVAKIAFDASGTCLGVETTAGDIFTSKHAVLCTRARTAELIAESAPEKPDFKSTVG
jgi:sarcosine oxidase/L-pipecolate oxidase